MLPEVLAHANILDAIGSEISDRIFHPSGWKAPNDTDSGISFGEVVEVGLGYMRMDLLEERSRAQYTLRGGYIEVGYGIGETIKAKALTTAAGKQLAKMASQVVAKDFVQNSSRVIKIINKYLKKPQTDGVFLPGGSIGSFMMGPFMTRGWLTQSDFRYATWCYVYIEGDAGFGGNIGLMFLLDPKAAVTGGTLQSLMAVCTAWAPYWGLGVSLSLDIKVSFRIIQDVQMVSLSTLPV